MKYILIILILTVTFLRIEGQVRGDIKKEGEIVKPSVSANESAVQDTSRQKKIVIENANSQKLDASTDTTFQYLQGDVRIFYDSTYFYADTAVLTDYVLRAWGNVSIVKGDSLKLFSDSLIYYPDSSMAYFYGYEDGNVVLENADNQLFTNYLIYDLDRDIAMYTNRGLLITGDSKVKSGRGFFHVKSKYANFYDDVTVEGNNYDILTDSLRYYSDTKKALFLAPVVVNQENKRIYSNEGFYDLDDNIGEFIGEAQFVEDENVSTADKIEYNGKEEITALLGQAKYKSEKEYGEADSIYYNQKTEKIKLQGNASFKNTEMEVEGDLINYDKKTEAMDVEGRSFLSNPPYLITADDLDYEKSTGLALADGKVEWKDTSSNYTIYADHIRYKEQDSYVKAYNDTGKPILENLMNEAGTDTLFLSGDTLIAYQEVYEEQDTQKVFLSYKSVEILMEDMQAICDSLTYIEKNDQFVLYQQPVMWSDSSQFSGDTIFLQLKDETIDQVELHSNALIISTEDMVFFNQIAGMRADARFQSKKLDELDVVGDAKSVYYLLDDAKAYIGANETACRRMIFKFEDGDLKRIRFYEENNHTLTPMDQVNHEAIKVAGYNWDIDSRPLTLEDLKN